MSDSHGSLRAIFLALGANFFIAAAKFAAALFTGSGSMLAIVVGMGLSRQQGTGNADSEG